MGPNRLLKSQIFEKKGILSSEKHIVACFSRLIECDKPQRTVCKGPKGFSDNCFGTYRAIF